jgi:hypothetical protein
LTRAARAALLAACAIVALLLALVPRPSDSPLGRLGNFEADGPSPRFDAPLDAEALRRAGRLVPDDETYLVAAPGADPLLQGNLKAAAQLYLAPSLPVQSLDRAQWALAYLDGEPEVPGRSLGSNLWLFDAEAPGARE